MCQCVLRSRHTRLLAPLIRTTLIYTPKAVGVSSSEFDRTRIARPTGAAASDSRKESAFLQSAKTEEKEIDLSLVSLPMSTGGEKADMSRGAQNEAEHRAKAVDFSFGVAETPPGQH